MKRLNEPLPGVLDLQAFVIEDPRGSFSETFNRRSLLALGVDHHFVQDNESYSRRRGTVRGLHLQTPPHAQGKLVRVLRGAILDVAVDLRPDSPTYRQHAAVELVAGDNRALWIPPTHAHGYCTLVDDTLVSYKVTTYYEPEAERAIRFDDPDLGIEWPLDGDAILSERDAAAGSLAEFEATSRT